MRWCTGWEGGPAAGRTPLAGRAVPGLDAVWSVGWPADRVRLVRAGEAALVVVGECGADDRQLAAGLRAVHAGRWRELTAWPGSYLAVARRGAVTAVIGDLAGQHPVYWRQADGGLWWASAASPLAALDGAPVDPVGLAALVAVGQPDLLGERSLFRGVHRVPAGHLLLTGPTGPRTVRYEPAEYEAVNLREGAGTVRAALSMAVAARLDGRPVSADLAGLDSTTLACLAAQRQPVTAVTFTDPRIRDDDMAYARRTAAAVPGLDHQAASGTAQTVYYAGLDDLGALPVTDAPHPYTVTASVKRAVLDTVAARNSRGGVHFTGSGGDAVLDAGPDYLSDLIRHRQHPRLLAHAQQRARLRKTSLWAVLAQARPAARIGLPAAMRQTAAELRSRPREWTPQARRPFAWVPLLASADWMTAGARRQLADAVTEAADRITAAPQRLASWSERQDLAQIGANIAGWRQIALAEYGIELAAPYLDNEVIRACLAVPADQRGAPGRFKPLLAAAFPHDPVPGFALERTTKGGFNGISYAGLRRHARLLAELLGPASRLAALGLVTEAPIRRQLARAAAGQHLAQGAVHHTVAAEIWLRQLTPAPGAWWTEARTRAAA